MLPIAVEKEPYINAINLQQFNFTLTLLISY